MTGALAGWIALAAVPSAGLAGWLLRRFAHGLLARRMRPHFVVGYAALVCAFAHMMFSMGSMHGADSTGIWLATLALLALGLQVLLGSNLQSPGAYRIPLRRWHLVAFAAVMILAAGHVALNSAVFSQFTGRVGDVSVVDDPIGFPFRIAQQRLGVLEKTALAAHPVHGMRSGKVRAGTATARIAEQPEHAAFVDVHLRGSLGNQRGSFVSTQLAQQHERGLQRRIGGLRIDDDGPQQLVEARFAGLR